MENYDGEINLNELLRRQQESGGFGLYGHEVRTPAHWHKHGDPYFAVKVIDETVMEIAEKLNWGMDQLFGFMNSKLGRLAGDELTFLDNPGGLKCRQILEKYMKEFELLLTK